MNMKSLLLCLGLCSTLSVGSASGATLAREGNQLAKPDTLITLTEDELVAGLRAIAEAYRAKAAPRKQSELTAEHLRILKFQMLLNALGLGALPPQAQPLQLQQAPQPRVYNPSLQPTHSLPQQIYSLPERHIYSQPQPYPVYPQGYLPQPQVIESQDARLDRLEQMLLLLLQQRSNEPRIATVLPARNSGTKTVIRETTAPKHETQVVHNRATDSLLLALQQELVAIRTEQEKLNAEVNQEAKAQPTTAPQLSLQQPVGQLPQTMPLQPLTPAQPIVRVDTVVEVREVTPEPAHFKRQVFFAVGTSKLSPKARLTLNEVYRAMEQDPEMKLYLTGYASAEGNPERNALLSLRRSRAVLNYLIECGIAESRLFSVAGGVDHHTEERNNARRVDIELHR